MGTLKPDEKSHWILAEKGVTEYVPALSLRSLLQEHNVTRIDIFQVFLSLLLGLTLTVTLLLAPKPESDSGLTIQGVCSQVDTEGYDGRIVLQLDLETFSPMLVQIEADHLTPRELRRVVSHSSSSSSSSSSTSSSSSNAKV